MGFLHTAHVMGACLSFVCARNQSGVIAHIHGVVVWCGAECHVRRGVLCSCCPCQVVCVCVCVFMSSWSVVVLCQGVLWCVREWPCGPSGCGHGRRGGVGGVVVVLV